MRNVYGFLEDITKLFQLIVYIVGEIENIDDKLAIQKSEKMGDFLNSLRYKIDPIDFKELSDCIQEGGRISNDGGILIGIIGDILDEIGSDSSILDIKEVKPNSVLRFSQFKMINES